VGVSEGIYIMPKYYCHHCGVSQGIINPVSSSRLDDNEYKLEKVIKHTAPSSLDWGPHSVFNDSSYHAYHNYLVNTSASGFVEIDDEGRVNMAWYAGSSTGIKYRDGVFQKPTDGVKLVYHNNDETIHAFPIPMAPYETTKCANCGILVVIYP
jgi:hypothetical protein